MAVRQVGDYVKWSWRPGDFVELDADRSRPLTLIRAGVRFRRFVSRWRPHVIRVQGSASLPFVWLSLRGRPGNPRIFFTWQDSGRVLPQRGRAHRRMVQALGACEGVFGSSSDVASRLAQGGRLARVGVFHGGVAESPPADPSSPPLLLWIGRFEPAKDPEKLIRAAAKLHRSGLRFRVAMIGGAHPGSPYLDQIRDRVRRDGLENLIEMPGYVQDNELDRWYRDAAIGVQTSTTEGLSMALLEQVMRGLAILATDVGDTGVALDRGRCGVLIEREAEDDVLVEQLGELIRDPGLRAGLGRAARERARSEFSIEAMTRRARAIYEAAVRPEVAQAS